MAVVLGAAAVWLLLMRSPSGPSGDALAVDWSQWQSPTGFLLTYSGDSILKDGPILDITVAPRSGPQTKENQQ